MEEQHSFDAKLDELYRVGREHVRHFILLCLIPAYCPRVELEASERHQGFASYSPCFPFPPFNISNLFSSDNFGSILHRS